MLWINLIKEFFDYFLCSEAGDDTGSAEQIDGTCAEGLQRLQQSAAIEFRLWFIQSPNLLLPQSRFFALPPSLFLIIP